MKTLIAVTFLACGNILHAQEPVNDPYFPAPRQINLGLLITYSPVTPPPAIIADATYGITPRFSVGLVGGTTGALGLYGMKLNAQLFRAEQFRMLFRMLSVYYPERNGPFLFDRSYKYVMPWMLSMAVTDLEWKNKKNVRFSLGAGVLETHCIDDMRMWFNPNHDHHALADDGKMGDEKLIDVFMTLQAAVSIPVTQRFTCRAESFAVFNRNGLIRREVFKVTFPVNTYLSLIYSL